jgi:hypothetical protein
VLDGADQIERNGFLQHIVERPSADFRAVPQRVVQCADLRIVHQQFFDIVPVAVARLCVDIGGEPQFER